MRIITTGPEETRTLAMRLGRLLQPGDLIALEGDLGAGKTVFVQGLAQGLGITDVVTSPTYLIIQTYAGDVPLYHFDVYRLESGEDLEELGYEEFFDGDGVTVVEWAQRVQEYLPHHYLTIQLEPTQGDSCRTVTFIPRGTRYVQLVEELSRNADSRN